MVGIGLSCDGEREERRGVAIPSRGWGSVLLRSGWNWPVFLVWVLALPSNWPFLLEVGGWHFLLVVGVWAFLLGVRAGPPFLHWSSALPSWRWGLARPSYAWGLPFAIPSWSGRLFLDLALGVKVGPAFSEWVGPCLSRLVFGPSFLRWGFAFFLGVGVWPLPVFLWWWLAFPSCSSFLLSVFAIASWCGGWPFLEWGLGSSLLGVGIGFLLSLSFSW